MSFSSPRNSPSVVIDDLGAALEQDAHLARLERPGADLGTLQVLQHRHRLHLPARGGADAVEHLGVVLEAAVREVEARHVHAELEQLVDGVLGPSSRDRAWRRSWHGASVPCL